MSRTISRRTAAALALAASTALVLSACTGADDDAAPEGATPISFQLDWVKDSGFAGFFVADAENYYADAGLDVSFLDGGDVSSTAAVIAGGGAQIGIVSNMSRLIDAVGTGADLVAVGAIYQQSPVSYTI